MSLNREREGEGQGGRGVGKGEGGRGREEYSNKKYSTTIRRSKDDNSTETRIHY